jgi:hypothetical protein
LARRQPRATLGSRNGAVLGVILRRGDVGGRVGTVTTAVPVRPDTVETVIDRYAPVPANVICLFGSSLV